MKNSITYYAAWKNVFLAVALLSFLGHSTKLKAQTDVPEQIQINCGGPAYAYDGTTSWEIKGNQFLFREGADQMAIETGAPGIDIQDNYFYNIGVLCAKFAWGINTRHLTVKNNVIERVGKRQEWLYALLWTDGAFEHCVFENNTVIFDADRKIFIAKSSLPSQNTNIGKNIIISDDPSSAFTNNKTGVDASDNIIYGPFNYQCFENKLVDQYPLSSDYGSNYPGYGATLTFSPSRDPEQGIDPSSAIAEEPVYINQLEDLIKLAAVGSGIVQLEPGIYIEEDQIDIHDYDNITIIGAGRALTAIRGAGTLLDTIPTHDDISRTVFNVGNNFSIQDLQFDGQTGMVHGGIGWEGKDHITIQRVDFHDLRYGYVRFKNSTNVTIRDCYMSNLGMNFDDYLIKMGASDNVVIDNVIIDFAENSHGGIGIGITDFGKPYQVDNLTIKNCYIEGASSFAKWDPSNPSPAFAIECLYNNFSNCKIIDNILRAGVSLAKPKYPPEETSWAKDQYVFNGDTYELMIPIANTDNNVLYQSERYGKDITYNVPVPYSGLYTLRLHFAEIYWGVTETGGVGSRIFDVMSERDTILLNNYDILAKSDGPATAIIESFDNIYVDDGFLTIRLKAVKDNAKISGISVSREKNCDDVTLSSQAEVDAFTCSALAGTLHISGSDIVNLDRLAMLSKARVIIIDDNPRLSTVSGLSSLEEVMELTIRDNPALMELNGFEKITTLEALKIEMNENLNNIDGLHSLTSVSGDITIKENNALENLDGLSYLLNVGNNTHITNNPLLTSCCGIYYLLRFGVHGPLNLSDNGAGSTPDDILAGGPCKPGFALHLNCGGSDYSYNDLNFISDEAYAFGGYKAEKIVPIEDTDNDKLFQSERYGDVQYEIPVPNGLYIVKLHFAEIYWDVSEPGGPGSRVFHIDIENGGAKLNNFDILSKTGEPATALVVTSEMIYIQDNSLSIEFTTVKDNAKISGISVIGVESPGCDKDIILSSQAEINAFHCTEVMGSLIIENNNLTDLSPLNTIKKIHGDLKIENLDHILEIKDFLNLEVIGGDLYIGGNDNLKYLGGFSNLVTVLGSVQLTDGDQNTALEVIEGFESLERVNNDFEITFGALNRIDGFNKLKYIGGNFGISKCSNLVDEISAFETLRYVGSCRVENNSSLRTIAWLSNLTQVEGDLRIAENQLLEACCDLYPLLSAANIGGAFDISDNGNGCDYEDILAHGPCMSTFAMNINCGDSGFSFNDTIWISDEAFARGGNIYEKGMPISGTENDKLYQSERYGDISYEIDVLQAGFYTVSLHFAEIYWGVSEPGGPGRRVFNVDIENGEATLEDFDILTKTGPQTALMVTFETIHTPDPILSIDFSSVTDNAKISGISISRMYDGQVVLSSQADVNAFDYEKIYGSLTISGEDIRDLSPLSRLQSIEGIHNENGCRPGVLSIINNPNLVSLRGLSSLGETGGILIKGNDKLISLEGLKIGESIGGHLGIHDNPALVDIDVLSSLQSIQDPCGDLYRWGNLAITNNGKLDRFCPLYVLLCGDNVKNVSISNNGTGYTEEDIVAQGPCSEPAFALRINCGGPAFEHNGISWTDGKGCCGGFSFQNTISIDKTENDRLYQSESYGQMQCDIPLPEAGYYSVSLHFAEIYWGVNAAGGAGSRIFDVNIENDQAILDDYDILSNAGAPARAVIETFNNIYVDDGYLTIRFKNVKDNAKISGMEVRSASGSYARMAGHDGMIAVGSKAPGESGIRIYPNPTNNSFTLDTYLEQAFEADLVLYDFLGNKTDLGRYEFERGSQTLEIDLASYQLRDGIYILWIAREKAGELRNKVVYRK